jgi:hypothetical protein
MTRTTKGTIREFDFDNMVILLKGQVFFMSHNRLEKAPSANLSKPLELQMNTLLDPGVEDGEFLKMQYYCEDTVELKLNKEVFTRALARDLLEVGRFPLFEWFEQAHFMHLYAKMKVHLLDQPSKVIYAIGDKADSLFVVRQGMV